MALTLFVVVSSQIGKLSTYIDLIIKVIPIYIAFMIIMPIISDLLQSGLSLIWIRSCAYIQWINTKFACSSSSCFSFTR